MAVPADRWRELFIGLNYEVPLLGGGRRTYINFDNAATTPVLRAVLERVNQSAEWYSSVHRGTGFKSLLADHAFDRCRSRVMNFVGADSDYHTAIFCANATDALNRLAVRLPLGDNDVVLSTVMEHHSNLLPWRFRGRTDYIKTRWPCGILNLKHLEERLRRHNGRVRLVAVTGASNVTGLTPPLKRIARIVHNYGALLLVDVSQLIAHRRIRMGTGDDPERIDFLAFSGHKMYAPFGSGVLLGPRSCFDEGRPSIVGGGAVDLVSLDNVAWAETPEKEEAGSPNLLGICAMANAMRVLEQIGMDQLEEHERNLTHAAIARLRSIKAVHIFGGCDQPDCSDRLGVIPIQVEGINHALLAAILGFEWGIGVRNGCFCAQPYVAQLLHIPAEEFQHHFALAREGVREERPGFVRISLGPYNTEQEIDYLAHALSEILKNGPQAHYSLDHRTRKYHPDNFDFDLDSFLFPDEASIHITPVGSALSQSQTTIGMSPV